MKNRYSLFACFVAAAVLIVIRLLFTETRAELPLKVTTWDALGYYFYLPSKVIYHDDSTLKWFPAIDSTYALSGGELYQANRQENGRFVFKYLRGISILQTPFFLLAHLMAPMLHAPGDGFSWPYQYAIAWGCLCYVILSVFLLRVLLLRYYPDKTVALSMLLLVLASNLIQYVAIDAGQSHGYLFPLYVLLLWATLKWQDTEQKRWSIFIGLIIGTAVISRPTEAVMLFIPLLWLGAANQKWNATLLRLKHKPLHLALASFSLLIALLPQLLYWKQATGHWVYDVGSKWDFLNPHFRVLFGWEKGWFVYTPVTIFFVAGLFLLKSKPFQRAIMTFCLLNIYIIIAWHVWRYGGSYSCRALAQSYPVFAFPLCASIAWINERKVLRLLLFPLSLYLIGVNLFQIWQYNRTILHYDDMNPAYYRGIYLNPHPDELTMSMLDTHESLPDSAAIQQVFRYRSDSSFSIVEGDVLIDRMIPPSQQPPNHLLIQARITGTAGLWGSYLTARIPPDTQALRVRLFHPLAKEGQENRYAFYLPVSAYPPPVHLELRVEGNKAFQGTVVQWSLTGYSKKD